MMLGIGGVGSGGNIRTSINQTLGPNEFRKLNSISCSGKARIYLHIKDSEKFFSKKPE